VILLILVVALTAVSVMLMVRALGGVSLGGGVVSRRIREYGFGTSAQRREAIEARPTPKALVGSIAETVGRLLAERSRSIRISALRQDLLRAGLHQVTPYKLLGYQGFSALILPALVIWLGSASGYGIPLLVLATLVALAAGWVLPHAIVRRRGRLRLVEIDDALPDLIDLLVVTVEAGLSFAASLRLAAERVKGALGQELRLTLQEQNLGLATNEALENLLTRVDTPSLRSFVRSVLQGETLGVSIGVILRNIAGDMRKRRRANAEERAHKAPVKMLFPLILFIFPSMFVVILVPAVFSFLDAFK
jgi:tight adherence protein C